MPVGMLSLLGWIEAAAVTVFGGMGLMLGTIAHAVSAKVLVCGVTSENPPARTSLGVGLAVALVVSSGT